MNKTVTIKIAKRAGKFAENKDTARDIRINTIQPAINKNQKVVIDFSVVEATTQSFVHALISQLIREHGIAVLNILYFKDCNDIVKKIIEIVVDYMQHEDKTYS